MTRAREQELVRLAMEGDREAAAALIRGHQQQLFVYLYRMCGQAELAEDAVQEAFVRVLLHLDKFDPRYRFSTWLFTIGRRAMVNLARKRAPASASPTLGRLDTGAGRPEDGAVEGEVNDNARTALERALAELPEGQRAVVVLYHQLDWPVGKIAQHLEMPEGTVKSHLYRGRKRLRVLMEEHERSMRHVGEVWA